MISIAERCFALICIAAALAPLAVREKDTTSATAPFPGWPQTFENRVLTPLPLAPQEQVFQQLPFQII